MKKKITLIYLIFGFFWCIGFDVNAQINFSTPSIAFTQACASSGFNTFNFSFSFFPASGLQPGNQFIVELSNSTGSFASPTVVKVLTNTTSPVSSNFSLPTNAYGEGYRIRVRSTAPVKISNPSNAFAAYYAVHNQPFAINSNVGTVNICTGDSYTLQVNDTGTPASPVYYPSLTYVWYKDLTEIPGATGPSLTITAPGQYYAIVDYGSCTMNSYSNIVQVNVLPDLSPSITSQGNSTIICPGDTNTLTSSITSSSYTYQWYKDNVQIAGATATTYNASEAGVYHVAVANGPCAFDSNAISLDVLDFSLTLDPDTTTPLIPGDTVTLTAIDDANSPSYQWYKDGVALSGQTSPAYNATQAGIYKVIVTQTSPCNITKESEVTIVYPSSFDLGIQPSAAYADCVNPSVTLAVSQFNANTIEGVVNLISNPYGYTYQWYKNSVIIAGATSATININDASQNGIYHLAINVPGYGNVTSNTFEVNIPLSTITITGDTLLCEGSSIVLTSAISSPNFTYQWYRNGTPLSGETASTLSAVADGAYYVSITSGNCTGQSNTINVEVDEITVTSTFPDTDVIIPGETKTITVSTDAAAPAFAWEKDGASIPGTTPTAVVTQEGSYTVQVTQMTGCAATAEKTFVLEYPSAFNLNITTAAGYTACASASANLNVSSFIAVTTDGNVNVATMPYAYQWYKNNIAVSGATSASLSLSSATQNGSYKLGVTIPDFGEIFSNDITITLAVEPISIANNTVLCEGSTVLLSANVNSGAYIYQWYKDNVAITGAVASTYAADSEGNYHLQVSAGPCSAVSNTITLTIADITVSSTSPDADTILPGETKVISISTDAQIPAYAWTRNGSPISNTTATLNATQDGVYVVTVTQTDGCPATAQKTFTLTYPSAFNITVAPAVGYTPCVSGNATINMTTFTATTPNGVVDVASMGYPLQWYKDNVVVPGQTMSTINILNATQNGDYKLGAAVPGFGTIFSNIITINLAVESVTINSNSALCEGGTVILTSAITDAAYTYQWFKDGTALAGANAPVFTANAEGDYYVQVTGNACSAQSNTITLTIAQITVSSTFPSVEDILPGETKVIAVTTNAASPTYSWTRNGLPTAVNTATFNATQDGTYTVTVTQTTGCNATEELTFTLNYPSAFNLTVAAGSGYTSCASSSTTVNMQGFTAITSNGVVDVTSMGYALQWYKDDVAISGEVSTFIAINNASQNGDYKLGAVVPGVGTIFSNTISINLSIGTVTISSDTALCEGGSVNLSSNVTDPSYNYQWFKDGLALGGANTPYFTANAEGNYQLEVTSGSCVAQSNPLNLTIGQISINSTFPDNDVILPGETKVITVSTNAQGPVYSWTRNGVAVSNSTPTLSVTQDGEYVVTVTQTTGCSATSQKTFILEYPSGFNLTIGTDAGYTACTSTSATLEINSFMAITSSGNIDVTSAGYAYQWYLNGNPVSGASSSTLTVNDASQNGDYHLVVAIPGFEPVVSNSVAINISLDPVVINAAGDICESNPSVAITSAVTNAAYTYIWYKDGIATTATNPVFTATETGDYYLVINTGTCAYTSNTVTITEGEFELTTGNITTEYLVPGESISLSVSTDAFSPQYEWYRNDVLLSGETSASLTVTLDGEYKVVVTQTQGCVMSNELSFMVEYATDFQIDIEAAGYLPCSTTSTSLTILDFSAATPAGPVDVEGVGYGYQWYMDGLAISGANTQQYTATQSGDYYLEVAIPEIGTIISNTVAIHLGFENDVTITSDGVLCTVGGHVTLTSDANNPAYSYKWYNEANEVIGTESTIIVSEPGSYYLAITFQSCIITSNILDVELFNENLVTLDSEPSLSLLEGTTTTVTANGADSYEWFMNGTSVSTGPTITISGPGNYSVIATVGECQVTKVVEVTTRENNLLAIPNVITPNNDGINDKWVLPAKYAVSTTEVVIYGPTGAIVFRASNYNNNWPESDFTYPLNNPVYYYTIMENNEITERGSITLIK